jgi:hypothetical protein
MATLPSFEMTLPSNCGLTFGLTVAVRINSSCGFCPL